MGKNNGMCTSPWGENSDMTSFMSNAFDSITKEKPQSQPKKEENVVGKIINLQENENQVVNSLSEESKKNFKKLTLDLSEFYELENMNVNKGIADFKQFKIQWK